MTARHSIGDQVHCKYDDDQIHLANITCIAWLQGRTLYYIHYIDKSEDDDEWVDLGWLELSTNELEAARVNAAMNKLFSSEPSINTNDEQKIISADSNLSQVNILCSVNYAHNASSCFSIHRYVVSEYKDALDEKRKFDSSLITSNLYPLWQAIALNELMSISSNLMMQICAIFSEEEKYCLYIKICAHHHSNHRL